MTTSTAVEPAANDPQARAGYGIRATFKRDGIRTVGWYGFDPPKALCSCGAESGPLRTSSAARAWLTDHPEHLTPTPTITKETHHDNNP